MLQHIYLAPGVEIVLLMTSLDVVMSDVGVLKYPAQTIKSPPTVSIVLCGSSFCGL